MAISAIRFDTFDQETALPVADFLSGLDSSIYNSPNINLPIAPESLKGLFDAAKDQIDIDALKGIKDQVTDAVRKAKGIYGSIQDLSKLTPKDITSAIGDMFPATALGRDAAAAFKALSSSCATPAFKKVSIGKPYDFNITCGSNTKSAKDKKGCKSSAAFNNVLSKLTGGAYEGAVDDLNKTLQNLVNLGSFGYSANMCGVWNALAGSIGANVGQDLLARAGGAIFDEVASAGNLFGFMDLAASTAGLPVLGENPAIVSTMLNNFNIPEGVAEKDYADLSEKTLESLSAVDPGWNIQDGSMEPDDISDCDFYSDDFGDILNADQYNTNSFDLEEMDIPVDNENTAICASFDNLSEGADELFSDWF